MNLLTRTAILTLALSAAGGCGRPGPRAIVEGQDSCDYCRMSISDVRFGTQLITTTGKIHTFDSVECLVGFAASLPAGTSVSGIFVSDFRKAGTFVPAEEAVYVVDGRIESPMGRRVVAFAASADRDELAATYGGTVKDWSAVQALLAVHSGATSGVHTHAHSVDQPPEIMEDSGAR